MSRGLRPTTSAAPPAPAPAACRAAPGARRRPSRSMRRTACARRPPCASPRSRARARPAARPACHLEARPVCHLEALAALAAAPRRARAGRAASSRRGRRAARFLRRAPPLPPCVRRTRGAHMCGSSHGAPWPALAVGHYLTRRSHRRRCPQLARRLRARGAAGGAGRQQRAFPTVYSAWLAAARLHVCLRWQTANSSASRETLKMRARETAQSDSVS